MADVPTVDWDETSPADSQDARHGDDRIRELKTQLRQVVASDHKIDASGKGATWGWHKVLRLIQQAVDPATDAAAFQVYHKLNANTSKGELYLLDPDGNVLQLTHLGGLYDVFILYGTGTVTLVNGSATVVGSGVGWAGCGAEANDFFLDSGYQPYRISSFDSDVQLTLTAPYAGVSAVGSTYVIYNGRHHGYMPSMGGQIFGRLDVDDDVTIGGNEAVTGNQSVSGVSTLASLILGGEAVDAGANKMAAAVGTYAHGAVVPYIAGYPQANHVFFPSIHYINTTDYDNYQWSCSISSAGSVKTVFCQAKGKSGTYTGTANVLTIAWM